MNCHNLIIAMRQVHESIRPFSGFASRAACASAMRKHESECSGVHFRGPILTPKGWAYWEPAWSSVDAMTSGAPHEFESQYGTRRTLAITRVTAMKFTITIDCDNDSLADSDYGTEELARILRKTADKVETCERAPFSGRIMDINGNRVGRYEMSAK